MPAATPSAVDIPNTIRGNGLHIDPHQDRRIAVFRDGPDGLTCFGPLYEEHHGGHQQDGGDDHIKPQLRDRDAANAKNPAEPGRYDDLLMPEQLKVDALDHHSEAEGDDEGVDVVGVAYRAIGEHLDQKPEHKPDSEGYRNGRKHRKSLRSHQKKGEVTAKHRNRPMAKWAIPRIPNTVVRPSAIST